MAKGLPTSKRRRRWRWAAVAAVLVAAAAFAVTLLPGLLPDEALRAEVEAALAARLGRAVTLESASLGWDDGLACRGLVVAGAEGETEPFARARRLQVRFAATDAVAALWGRDVPVRLARIEGLEVRLARGPDGRWNVPGPLTEEWDPNLRAVQVVDGRVTVETPARGRTLTLTSVAASVGSLATTGQGYVTFSAEVSGPGEASGRVAVTASLASLTAPPETAAGSVKVEWEDVASPEAWAGVVAGRAVAHVAEGTSGRVAATFDHGAWSAEGAVEAYRLAPDAPLPHAATLDHAVVGFQVSRGAGEASPYRLALVSLSVPGLNVRVSGEIRPREGAGPEVDVRGDGTIAWDQLGQSFGPLARAAEGLDRLGGEAQLELEVVPAGEGAHRARGTVDLTATEAALRRVLCKEPGQPLRIDFTALVPRGAGPVELERLDVATAAGRFAATARLPRAGDGTIEPAGASVRVRADLGHVERLLDLAPCLAGPLGRAAAEGAVRATLEARPVDGPEEAWRIDLEADLTGARLGLAPPASGEEAGNEGESVGAVRALSPTKEAGVEARLAATGLLAANGRSLECREAVLALGGGEVRWSGAASFSSGAAPRAAFEGTLHLAKVDALLGGLGRDAPVAGDLAATLKGGIAEAKLTASLGLVLTEVTVEAPPYLVKPAGRELAASLDVAWLLEAPYFLDLEATVRAPGAVVTASSHSQFEVSAADRADEASGGSTFTARSGAVTRVKVDAEVSDLEAAMALAPAVRERLDGRARGAARVVADVFTIPNQLRVSAEVDLAGADLDLGRLLVKEAGTPLEVSVSADARPALGAEGRLLACEAAASARLGRSTTSVTGTLRVAPPAGAVVLSPKDLGALVRESLLKVQADWHHGPVLARAVPWLAPLYARCPLEGPTSLRATFEGTPYAGRLEVDLAADDCRIAHRERAAETGDFCLGPLKEAGTPLGLHLEARFGQVPGELVVDTVRVELGEAEAAAAGRFFFDDPRLTSLAPPTAWMVRAKGRAPKLDALFAALPASLESLRPRGGARLEIEAAGDPFGVGVRSCNLTLEDVAVEWLGRTVHVSGPLDYDGRRLATEGLDVRVGGSDVRFVGYVTDPADAPVGTVFLRGERMVVEEVRATLTEAAAHLAREAPEPDPAARKVAEGMARRLRRALARAEVRGDVAFEEVELHVAPLEATYDLSDFTADVRLVEKRLAVPKLACAVNHGTVTGELDIDFAVSPPVLTVAYYARDLKARENMKPFIEQTFPDMHVDGTLSQRETKRQALAAGSHAVGRGETVLTDGVLQGPGAPDYIAGLFPGLKLTTYRFKTMSNVFELEADGTVQNRMIFDGTAYDIYLFGHTRADGRFHYTLGVDLSVSLGSTVWSRTLDQGKIPLMHYTGRIVGTEYAERHIRYVLPHELAFDVFVKRNLLVQLIQSLGREPPDFTKLPRPPEDPEP